ncbi:hypothetical protein [Microbulbifer guangxiensis]|uniref:hypothetical protein n=1 Tax=Microbulbifer guangxiensis TaxID=2904249 RepID=UPI001F1CC8F6|nr:hypothetical protein [Microbulbifer guangxiensis]
MTDVATAYTVPEQQDVTFNFTLKPTGADQQWEFKDKNSGEAIETIHIIFEGAKANPENSGKATLVVELIGTELVFADHQKIGGNDDGMETYDEVNGGLGAIKKAKKMNGSPQFLEIDLKANKQTANGFSFKWAAQDATGAVVLSADPTMAVRPV